MNKQQIFLAIALFTLLSCFAFSVEANGLSWLWTSRTEVPISLGTIAAIFFLLYLREQKNARSNA